MSIDFCRVFFVIVFFGRGSWGKDLEIKEVLDFGLSPLLVVLCFMPWGNCRFWSSLSEEDFFCTENWAIGLGMEEVLSFFRASLIAIKSGTSLLGMTCDPLCLLFLSTKIKNVSIKMRPKIFLKIEGYI